MNLEQYGLLRYKDKKVDVSSFAQKDKTLIYGYTLDRHTHHVYAKNGQIFSVIYDYDEKILSRNTWKAYESIREEDIAHVVPDKRLYPEMCDYLFCDTLEKNLGVYLPFTTFEAPKEQQDFYGLTLEQLKEE